MKLKVTKNGLACGRVSECAAVWVYSKERKKEIERERERERVTAIGKVNGYDPKSGCEKAASRKDDIACVRDRDETVWVWVSAICLFVPGLQR